MPCRTLESLKAVVIGALGAGALTLGGLFDWLTAAALAALLVWRLLKIWETPTIQRLWRRLFR